MVIIKAFLYAILLVSIVSFIMKTIIFLQNQVRKAQKKIAEENLKKAIEVANEIADVAVSNGQGFCISRVSVGLDVSAVREAVVKVIEQKVIDKILHLLFSFVLCQLALICGFIIYSSPKAISIQDLAAFP